MNDEGILWGNLWISLWIYVVGMVDLDRDRRSRWACSSAASAILDKILSPYVWAIYTTPRLDPDAADPAVGRHQRHRPDRDHRALRGAGDARGGHGGRQDRRQLAAQGGALVRGQPLPAVPRRWSCPSTVPFIATGVRMGVSRGLIGLFIGELFTGVERDRLHHHAVQQDVQQRADLRDVVHLRPLLRRDGRARPSCSSARSRSGGASSTDEPGHGPRRRQRRTSRLRATRRANPMKHFRLPAAVLAAALLSPACGVRRRLSAVAETRRRPEPVDQVRLADRRRRLHEPAGLDGRRREVLAGPRLHRAGRGLRAPTSTSPASSAATCGSPRARAT